MPAQTNGSAPQTPAVTIDAAVFVGNAVPGDTSHAQSAAFLREIRARRVAVTCPLLCTVEVAAAVTRRTGSVTLATVAVQVVRALPLMSLVPFTEPRTVSAEQVAISARLRGADSIYVATAQEFGTTLITWDGEVINRAASLITVMTPTDWLVQNPPQTP